MKQKRDLEALAENLIYWLIVAAFVAAVVASVWTEVTR